jgi:hypothetical protein
MADGPLLVCGTQEYQDSGQSIMKIRQTLPAGRDERAGPCTASASTPLLRLCSVNVRSPLTVLQPTATSRVHPASESRKAMRSQARSLAQRALRIR